MEIPLDVEVDNKQAKQIMKTLSMPIGRQPMHKKTVSKAFSHMTDSTVSSSMTDRYAEEPVALTWGEGCEITYEHTKIFEKCNKYEKDKQKIHFDWIASNYEGMYTRMGYPDPEKVAKFVHKIAKKNEIKPEDAKIIDFGCGTGLIGKHLAKSGYKKIVGLDISPNMLEECSNSGVYSELHEHEIGEDPNNLPCSMRNQFDFCVCTGLINNNYMDYLLFEEMLLSVKKGGYVVFAARYSFMGKYWYDKIIKEMHENGRWKLVATDTHFKYDKLECVSIGRFSKTPSKVYVFQKTQEELN